MKIYGTDPIDVSLALEGAPSLVDNPRQLALERERKEQQKKQTAQRGVGVAAAPRSGAGRMIPPPPGPGPSAARHLQIESRGKSGKRRIQPMLMSSGGGGAAPQALTVAATTPAPMAGATVSEGFGYAPNAAAAATDSPRSGSKRPRAGGGGGGGGSGSGQHAVVGTRSLDGTVVRLKSARGMPVVSPPELMPRKSATGSLVRQITSANGESGDAFRASPRVRKAPATAASMGDDGGLGVGLGLGHGGNGGGGGVGAAVMECSALEEDFQGLPARRYTLVTVSRGGREVWRDYVAGMATACCGNDRIAAVGAEDGSVYIYDR